MTTLWALWLLAGGGWAGSAPDPAVPPAWPGVEAPIQAVYRQVLGAPPALLARRPEARHYVLPGPQDLPDPQTGPVPLVIVTTDALREPFDSLAAWHTRNGLPAVVRTTSWIYTHYTGSDPPERIRHFLQEAWRQWGTRYVLLGGGANEVPPRYVHVRFSHDSTENWVPADLYYACLDGSWNADGDAVFGEPEDSLDLVPELLVGRVPALFPEEAWNYVRKAIRYREVPGGDSSGAFVEDPQRILLLGTLIGLNHGPLYCEFVAQHLPADRTLLKLYETEDHDNSLEDVLGALGSGVGFFYLNGHGNYNNLYANYDPAVPMNAQVIETRLPNKDHPPFMKAVVCDAGAWDRFGVLMRLLLVPRAGVVGIIGVTRFDIPASELVFDTLLARVLYRIPQMTFGTAALSLVGALPLVDQDSVIRYLYLSKTLLGDPALLFWQQSPRRFRVEMQPAVLSPGVHSLRLTVRDSATGEPVPGVTVAAYKAAETYAVASTGPAGRATLQVSPQSPGTLWVALRHGDYLPFRKPIAVASAHQDLRLVGYRLTETQGDGDGQVDAGEVFRLVPVVRNFGRDTAYALQATWIPEDPWLRMLHAPQTLDHLPPGKEAELAPGAALWIAADPPQPYARLTVTLRWQTSPHSPVSGTRTWQETLRITLRAPAVVLSHFSQEWAGVTLNLHPHFVNIGTDDAEELQLVFQLVQGAGTVLDSVVVVPVLPADSQPHDTALALRYLANPEDPPVFQLTVYQGLRQILSRLWSPTTPAAPANLRALREIQTLDLSWDARPGTRYRVFRKAPGETTFRLLTPVPLALSRFADAPLSHMGPYAYFVEAVDSFGNLSAPSETLWVSLPRLHPGFPAASGISQESNHPVAADLDPAYPGLDIVFGDLLGRIYAYHADGTPVAGWPVEAEPEIWNAPAVADLDQDGLPEVVVAPRSAENRVYVFQADGTPKAGWPQSYPGGNTDGTAGAYASPVLADLDGDGNLEILLHTLQGRLLIWRADGTPFQGSSPEVFTTGADNWDTGTPAVADLDHDGLPEILLPSNSHASVYALKPDGTVLPGFPLNLNLRVKSPVAVAEIQGQPTLAFVANVGAFLGSVEWRRADGTSLPGFPKTAFFYWGGLYAQPSFVDFNGDGVLDLAVNRGDSVVVYDTLGHTLLAAAVSHGQNFGGVVGQTGQVFYNDEKGLLWAWTPEGVPQAFPLALYDHITTTPVVADLDVDDSLEYVVLTTGRLLVFDLPTATRDAAWAMFQYDARHQGFAPEPDRHPAVQGAGPLMPPLTIGMPYPQPFRHTLTLPLTLPEPGTVRLVLMDAAGRRRSQKTWHLGRAGSVLLRWTPPNLASGVYFLRIHTPWRTETRRLLHVR